MGDIKRCYHLHPCIYFNEVSYDVNYDNDEVRIYILNNNNTIQLKKEYIPKNQVTGIDNILNKNIKA